MIVSQIKNINSKYQCRKLSEVYDQDNIYKLINQN